MAEIVQKVDYGKVFSMEDASIFPEYHFMHDKFVTAVFRVEESDYCVLACSEGFRFAYHPF